MLLALLLVGSADAASDSDKRVQASEIMAKFREGEPLEYDNCIVEGNLDLREKTLGAVHFNKTEFRGSVQFYKANFSGDSFFSGARFGLDASFQDAQFSGGYASFSDASFSGGDANFWGADFSGGDAIFDRAEFSGGSAEFLEANFSREYEARFYNTKFSGGDAIFRNATFSGKALFEHAKFSGGVGAYFQGAKFLGKTADFSHTDFFKDVNFSNAESSNNSTMIFSSTRFSGPESIFSEARFGGEAYFNEAEFSGAASLFEATEFSGKVTSFRGAKFLADYISFEKAQFNSPVDFKEAYFDKVAYFSHAKFRRYTSFYGAKFNDDAFFEGAAFSGELDLTRTNYKKFFIKWKGITKFTYDDSAFILILKNYKDLGYLEDYDDCYYEYRKERRAEMKEWHKILGDGFLQVASGYGTKPLRPLIFSSVIIILFSLVWRAVGLVNPNGVMDVYRLKEPVWGNWHGSRTGKAIKYMKTDKRVNILRLLGRRPILIFLKDMIPVIFYSATVFLSGTKLFIDPPNTPKIVGAPRHLIKGLFITERILGAILSILFIMAISWTVVRPL